MSSLTQFLEFFFYKNDRLVKYLYRVFDIIEKSLMVDRNVIVTYRKASFEVFNTCIQCPKFSDGSTCKIAFMGPVARPIRVKDVPALDVIANHSRAKLYFLCGSDVEYSSDKVSISPILQMVSINTQFYQNRSHGIFNLFSFLSPKQNHGTNNSAPDQNGLKKRAVEKLFGSCPPTIRINVYQNEKSENDRINCRGDVPPIFFKKFFHSVNCPQSSLVNQGVFQ